MDELVGVTDTEKDTLEARIDELCAELGRTQLNRDMWHDRAETMRNRLSAAQDENAKLREQTELLVTLLRNDCDIEASWDGLRKLWYIGLTESGCLMRDRACKAEAENAKLRELCSGLAQVVKNDDDTFRRLREIAKQELSCDFIGMYDSSLGEIDQIARFIDSMAELGIEVPS